jgi:hypothetical protein
LEFALHVHSRAAFTAMVPVPPADVNDAADVVAETSHCGLGPVTAVDPVLQPTTRKGM